MAYPTCALARHPVAPPAGDNPPDQTQCNLATLAKQANGQINALREAYQAAACIHSLVAAGRAARGDEFFTAATEAHTLMALVNSEFERRIQLAKATIASMQST